MKTIAEAGFEMHDPPHPGGVFRRLYSEPLGLTVTETARRLAVSRKQLSLLINERAGSSPDSAHWYGDEHDARVLGNMQAPYNLCQAKRRTNGVKVRKLAA